MENGSSTNALYKSMFSLKGHIKGMTLAPLVEDHMQQQKSHETHFKKV